MGGGKEKKKKRRIIYRRSGERSAEKAETIAFPNRKPYKTYFIKKAVRLTLSVVFWSSGYQVNTPRTFSSPHLTPLLMIQQYVNIFSVLTLSSYVFIDLMNIFYPFTF
jgi:hypothetical protein